MALFEATGILPPTADQPLLKAKLIPKRLVNAFQTPPEKSTHLRRGTTTTARVLTSEEIYNAFRDRDRKRKLAIDDKVENKRTRLEKKAKQAQVDQARQITRCTRKRKRPSKTYCSNHHCSVIYRAIGHGRSTGILRRLTNAAVK